MCEYYDILNKENFNKLFGNLEIGKEENKTSLANVFLVLKLNFSGLGVNTYEV